ncbi:MFS transporter [Paraconexibacter sp. AEG42_29]|uniref:MFS transporter n=1 Tax=Paraconexibacter sp. AEG42_29 TaxID=2997339 RepID=UPI00339DA707
MSPPALLRPLRHRDFALLWTGLTASLIGDGIFLVAVAWQVYDLSDSPSALSAFGVAWTLGTVVCLLLGGVAADRFDRRRIMIVADAVRLVCVVTLGVLAVTGTIELWHLITLAVFFGGAEGFFNPAFGAMIPQLVPAEDLMQANAFQEVARPLSIRLAGPAVGGVLVGLFGPGTALLIDGGTFVLCMACVLAITPQPRVRETVDQGLGAVFREVREGWAFVRQHAWLWGTLIAASLSLLCFYGPVEVLLPYLIRNDLDAPASAFGAVLAAGGAGGIAGALLMSRRGLPVKHLRLMYLAWGLGLLPIAGYAIAGSVWQLAILAALFGASASTGMVVWATLMQTRVPPTMLGRVGSLDWLVSIGLTPLSFALTAPIAALVGRDATLIGAGVLGCVGTLGLYVCVADLRRDAELWPQAGAATPAR